MARWLRFLVASALAGCGPGPADAPEGPASMEPEGTTGSNRSEPGPGEPTRPAEEDPMDEETSALSEVRALRLASCGLTADACAALLSAAGGELALTTLALPFNAGLGDDPGSGDTSADAYCLSVGLLHLHWSLRC